MAWKKILLETDAQIEVEAADPLALGGDVTIVGAGKSLEVINLKFETATTKTIAADQFTRDQVYHLVAGEGGLDDDLDGIGGGATGMLLAIRPSNGAVTITVRHNNVGAGVGNKILLSNGSDCTLDDLADFLLLLYDSTLDAGSGAWAEISRGQGDAATIGNAVPQAVDGTAGAAGATGNAADEGHIHDLGPLVAALDFDGNQAASFVLESAANPPDAAAETEGQLYYDTSIGDKHIYVWVP